MQFFQLFFFPVMILNFLKKKHTNIITSICSLKSSAALYNEILHHSIYIEAVRYSNAVYYPKKFLLILGKSIIYSQFQINLYSIPKIYLYLMQKQLCDQSHCTAFLNSITCFHFLSFCWMILYFTVIWKKSYL